MDVLKDRRNTIDYHGDIDAPYIQRARMADQLSHTLDSLKSHPADPKAHLIQSESGRGSPIHIKKKLRRLSEGLMNRGNSSTLPAALCSSDIRDADRTWAKENEDQKFVYRTASRSSSMSSSHSRPILKRKYILSSKDHKMEPKHVHFLSNVTVFQMGQDGQYVCTKCEKLNMEPKYRDTISRRSRSPRLSYVHKEDLTMDNDSVDTGLDTGHGDVLHGGSTVVTHAINEKPGGSIAKIGATVTSSNNHVPHMTHNSNTIIHNTIPTRADNTVVHKTIPVNGNNNTVMYNTLPAKLNNNTVVHTIPAKSDSNIIVHNTIPVKGDNNIIVHNTIPVMDGHMVNGTSHMARPVTMGVNTSTGHSHDASPGHINISFTQNSNQGTKLKFVVHIGQGYDPQGIVVKANMNGSRIRVMATKLVSRSDGSHELHQFNERYVLPMDIDPFTVDARLDSKGNLTVEAPLMTLERRQNLIKDNPNELSLTYV